MSEKTIDGFIRQPDNPGATMNTDNRALEAYKRRKQREDKINNMEKDIDEIKSLLQKLVKDKE